MKKYIAYGSNLNIGQMKKRCPDFGRLCWHRISRHIDVITLIKENNMITKKEIIEIIDGGWGIDLNEEGNFQHNGPGNILKSNKEPKFGLIEPGKVWLYIPNKIDQVFETYEEMLDYKIDGVSIYDRLKNESIENICTRILDDSGLYK